MQDRTILKITVCYVTVNTGQLYNSTDYMDFFFFLKEQYEHIPLALYFCDMIIYK